MYQPSGKVLSLYNLQPVDNIISKDKYPTVVCSVRLMYK